MVELLDDEVPGGGGDEFANPVLDAQLREMAELSVGKELPKDEDWMEDWKWIHDQDAANLFDPEWKFGGQYIAVYKKQIVGRDTDEFHLRIQLSKDLGIHPNRPVLSYRDYDE
jgi:hypothetical protein